MRRPGRGKVGNLLISVLLGAAFFLPPTALLNLTAELRPAQAHPEKSPDVTRGRLALKEGRFPESIGHFTKYLNSSPAEDRVLFECLWSLAVLNWNLDRLEDSRRYFERAGALAGKLKWASESERCRMALSIHDFFARAVELRDKYDIAGSNSAFRQAADAAEAIQSDPLRLKILRTWSVNFVGDLKSNEYVSLNKSALAAATAINHQPEIIRASNNLGTYYSQKSEYSFALGYFLQGLSYLRSQNEDRKTVFCLNNIASIYSTLGSYHKSVEYYTEALEISRRAKSREIFATILSNLGDSYFGLYRETGNVEYGRIALDHFRQSLESRPREGATDKTESVISARIGSVYAELGQLDEALGYLRPALEAAQKANNSELLPELLNETGSGLLKKNDALQAEVLFARAREIAARTGNDPFLAKAQYGLGLCAEKRGDFSRALSLYVEGLDAVDRIASKITDDLQRAEYAQNKARLFETLIDFDYRLAKNGASPVFKTELFRVIEKAKAGAFLDDLKRKSANGKDGVLRGAAVDEAGLRKERLKCLVALSSKNLTAAEKSHWEFELRQVEDMLNHAAAVKPRPDAGGGILPEPATPGVVQRDLLDARTALIEYWLGAERSYGIVVTRGTFRIFELPAARKIEDSISGYLEFLADPYLDPARGLPAAKRLYRELLAPAEQDLVPSITRLIIIPDGLLNDLPFETLIPARSGPGKPETLIRRFPIAYAPSSTALLYFSKNPNPGVFAKDLLAFGAPSYARSIGPGAPGSPSPSRLMAEIYAKNGFSLDALPGSQNEVARIALRFAQNKETVFTGDGATESALKAAVGGNYRVIHFAGHALSDESDPVRSALVLSPEESRDEDGFFQVREMSGLRLETDLVVLSACQTAKGKRLGHEGVLGLPRALFQTGARSVISSLWKIDDRATAEFMDAFYASYAAGGGKAEALRSAKLKIASSKYAHPYYWAGFVLTGTF